MLNWFKNNSKWVTLFVLGVALIAVYKTFDSFSVILSAVMSLINAFKPFIFAFVIAYILNIPIKKMESFLRKQSKVLYIKKHAYGISVTISFVVFIAVVLLIISSLLPDIYRSLVDMTNNIPIFIESTSEIVNALNRYLAEFNLSIDLTGWVTGISKWLNVTALNELGKYAQGLLSVTSGILNIFIALIASIYMLMEKKHLIRSARRMIRLLTKKDKSVAVLARCKSVNDIFMQYLYARFICCIVMAVVSTVVLSLMGAKYALLLGVFIGFMDLIPYFGSIISWVVTAVIILISDGAVTALWCSAIMLVLQQLDGNVLAPRVMGNRLEIRPLAIIVAVSVGGSLFGFIGMVISVPLVAIFKMISVEYMLTKEKQNRINRKMEQ